MAATRAEVIQKVTALVKQKFNGDFKVAFDAYDVNQDKKISLDELEQILCDAGVGFKLTRWAIAKEIIDLLDTNGDGFIDWAEFDKVLNPATKPSWDI